MTNWNARDGQTREPPMEPHLTGSGIDREPRPPAISTRRSTRTTTQRSRTTFYFGLLPLLLLLGAIWWGNNLRGFGWPTLRGIRGTGPPEAVIAVMGATGSGKTTFVNLASGSNLGVGDGLQSSTETVQTGGPFYLNGRRIVLIDTPGFDDSTRSDTDVLKMIAAFLATSYERGTTLAGIIYFHRISDIRVGGVSMRNFNMIQKLCGNSTLHNMVIVTNMWGEVDPGVGEAREAELMREDIFFKPVLEKGARMARHVNTVSSADKIIRLVLDNHPLPLRIQEELVDEYKDITETGAGKELNRELDARIKRYKDDMRVLRDEMQDAMDKKDEAMRMGLEIETQRVQREIERFQNDGKRLTSDYKKEKERLEVQMEQMESKARREADRVAAEHQRRLDDLRSVIHSSAEAWESEKAQLHREIRDAARRGRRRGFFSRIGGFLDDILL